MKKTLFQMAVIIIITLSNLELFAQGGNLNNTPLGNANDLIGWDGSGSATDLIVENAFNTGTKNIYFKTHNGTTLLQRMFILANGKVGVKGTATVATNSQFEVDNDINLSTSTLNHGYRIGDIVVLQNPGLNNICVGDGSGVAISGGYSNVLMGKDAGKAITTSFGNVIIGANAGLYVKDVNAAENTFVGEDAGTNTGNSLVAGGFENVFMGDAAGTTNTIGNTNTFIGAHTGFVNTTGSNNTLLGSQADMNAGNLFNASAIGAFARVNHDDQMTLGGDFTIGNVHHSTFVGIGLSGSLNGGLGPQNSLEINADPARSSTTATGLRFTQVKNNASNNTFSNPYNKTTINSWGKVLTVDISGEVGLTDDIGAAGAFNGTSIDVPSNQVQLGQTYLTGTGAVLVNDREIPMADHDIYFTEPAAPGGVYNNVGIGIATNPRTRLNVDKTTLSGLQMAVAGGFSASTVTGSALDVAYGVWCTANNTSHSTSFELAGGKFSANGSTKAGTYGVHGYGVRPDLAGPVWGGYFEAVGAPGGPMPPIAFAYGVEGRAQAKVLGTAHYAVYGNLGVACPTWPPVACPTAATFDYAGYFNGDVLSTTNLFLASDAALKENIQDITNPMDIINQLNPKSYTFKRDQNPSMQLSDSTHFGILAQELEGILPQLVKNSIHPPVTDSVGNVIYAPVDFKAINYIELIPFLIAGMKVQQQTIEAMQAQLSNCCGGGNRNSNTGGEQGNSSSIDVDLKNAKSIILNQNVPNPFAEQTTISYFLTDDVKKAQIFFYDNKGVILKIVDVNETGEGQLNVYASDLSSGNYTYSLIADGKLIETKKMVKTN